MDGPYNDIQKWDYDKMPILVGGGVGFKVGTEDELDSSITQALELSNQPALINIKIDQKDYTQGLKRMLGRVK